MSGPLVSWRCLLEQVAKSESLPCDAYLYDSLPLLWEALVTAAVRKRRRHAAYTEERRLRTRVVAILKAEAEGCCHAYDRNNWLRDFARALTVRPTHIIDLNFDSLLLKALGCSSRARSPAKGWIRPRNLRVKDARNMTRRWDQPGGNITLWKPHGWVGDPSSIRLGTRDYGFQPAAYSLGFQRFKEAERRSSARLDKAFGPCRSPPRRDGRADTWITRFMAFETSMIGVGMTSDEWALRWLCVQRDRNGARHAVRPIRCHLYSQFPAIPGVAAVSHGTWERAWQAAVDGRTDTANVTPL